MAYIQVVACCPCNQSPKKTTKQDEDTLSCENVVAQDKVIPVPQCLIYEICPPIGKGIDIPKDEEDHKEKEMARFSVFLTENANYFC